MAGPGVNKAGSGENLDNSLNTIISEFHLRREEGAVLKKLCTRHELKPHSGEAYNMVTYGTLKAYELTEGVDMAQAQALADTINTYKPREVGVQVIVSDTTIRRSADPQLFQSIGKSMRSAYNIKEDTDGCIQFDAFTSTLGGAGNVLGVGHILGARTRLRVGSSNSDPEPAPEPFYGVFHPGQISTLVGRLVPLATTPAGATSYGAADGAHEGTTVGPGRTSMSDEILVRGPEAVGRLFGITLYDDANIPVDSSNDAKGAVFSKAGLIYVSEFEAREVVEKDASLRAREINVVGSYVWGLYRPGAFGVEMHFDASLPTS